MNQHILQRVQNVAQEVPTIIKKKLSLYITSSIRELLKNVRSINENLLINNLDGFI